MNRAAKIKISYDHLRTGSRTWTCKKTQRTRSAGHVKYLGKRLNTVQYAWATQLNNFTSESSRIKPWLPLTLDSVQRTERTNDGVARDRAHMCAYSDNCVLQMTLRSRHLQHQLDSSESLAGQLSGRLHVAMQHHTICIEMVAAQQCRGIRIAD